MVCGIGFTTPLLLFFNMFPTIFGMMMLSHRNSFNRLMTGCHVFFPSIPQAISLHPAVRYCAQLGSKLRLYCANLDVSNTLLRLRLPSLLIFHPVCVWIASPMLDIWWYFKSYFNMKVNVSVFELLFSSHTISRFTGRAKLGDFGRTAVEKCRGFAEQPRTLYCDLATNESPFVYFL